MGTKDNKEFQYALKDIANYAPLLACPYGKQSLFTFKRYKLNML